MVDSGLWDRNVGVKEKGKDKEDIFKEEIFKIGVGSRRE